MLSAPTESRVRLRSSPRAARVRTLIPTSETSRPRRGECREIAGDPTKSPLSRICCRHEFMSDAIGPQRPQAAGVPGKSVPRKASPLEDRLFQGRSLNMTTYSLGHGGPTTHHQGVKKWDREGHTCDWETLCRGRDE